MNKISFQEALEAILREDPRYEEQAYHFVREALDFTVKMLSKPSKGTGRHVTGAELLDGIRQYVLQEFGPIGKTVLNRWGVSRSEDFGEIVFNLVEQGILGRTDEDKREDFKGGYDFEAAFEAPFRPGVTRSREDAKPQRKAE